MNGVFNVGTAKSYYLNKIIKILGSKLRIKPCIKIQKKNDRIVSDISLIKKLNNLIQKPKYIMINLGSGVQEPLSYYIKRNLNFKPGIICTGASIAYFTGEQANVPLIIDALGLGWLKRCIDNPRVFIIRYLKAFTLFSLILKAEVEFTKERGKDRKDNLQVNLEEFIAVKGINALGNQLTKDKVNQINLLDPLPYEAPEEVHADDIDVIDEEDVTPNDNDNSEAEDTKSKPSKNDDSSEEGNDNVDDSGQASLF